jgi:CBS domain-containing protein
MKIVRNILQSKGSQVWSVAPADSVYDALRLMAEKDIGAVLVLEGTRLAGIFTERDYARKVILKGKSSRDLAVGKVMTAELVTVRPQQTIAECMALMSRHHIRHLPVVDKGGLGGVISIGDVVSAIISEQAGAIERLEELMLGSEEV